jgi:hypothetical protein
LKEIPSFKALSRECLRMEKSRLPYAKVACYTAAIRTGRAEPTVVEKEKPKADGDLRILLETLQRYRIDQRVSDIPAAPSDSGSNVTARAKK